MIWYLCTPSTYLHNPIILATQVSHCYWLLHAPRPRPVAYSQTFLCTWVKCGESRIRNHLCYIYTWYARCCVGMWCRSMYNMLYWVCMWVPVTRYLVYRFQYHYFYIDTIANSSSTLVLSCGRTLSPLAPPYVRFSLLQQQYHRIIYSR